MFELVIFIVIVIGLSVISSSKENTCNHVESEAEYPHIDDPQFESKVRKYFKEKHFLNKFDHI
jgi:preprotein translocase subunit SecG